jgi:hypothetical protein
MRCCGTPAHLYFPLLLRVWRWDVAACNHGEAACERIARCLAIAALDKVCVAERLAGRIDYGYAVATLSQQGLEHLHGMSRVVVCRFAPSEQALADERLP